MVAATISLKEEAIITAFRSFLVSEMPSLDVILGQVNRVPEPQGDNFAVYWPLRHERLGTNILSYLDALAFGSIALTVLTVTAVEKGVLLPGTVLTDPDGFILPNTVITSQLSGTTGGAGTYRVSPSQTATPTEIRAGVRYDTQPTQMTLQVDVHGPNSWDNVQIMTTLFKSIAGAEFFDATGLDMAPLFCTEPKQTPFLNAEQQYENRWVIEAVFQCNPQVGTPQQFADQLEITLIDAVTAYPA